MEHWHIQLIETAIAATVYVISRLVLRAIIRKSGQKFNYHITRISLIKRIIEVGLMALLLAFLLFIWGVDQSELVFFITSMLTVVGVAFFAQWSMLSNITASVIIYFNHPIRVGDHIHILDKEFDVSGRVHDIGLFFLIIKTDDNMRITIPSNVFMQKMIRRDQDEDFPQVEDALD